MGYDMSIDLGSGNTRIYVEGKGIILDEPTALSVDLDTDEVIAYGDEAYAMLGRTSQRISTIFPVVRGVITDFSLTSQLIKHFFVKCNAKKLSVTRVLVSAPEGLTDVERFNLVNLVSSLGVKKVYLLDCCKAAAMGAGVDICLPTGRFTVDIGAGTTKIGLVSLGESAVVRSEKLAGNDLDEEIIKFIRKKYNIIIGKRTAESTKMAVCSAREPADLVFYKVKGKEALSGLPRAVEVSNFELLALVEDFAAKICMLIQEVLDTTPPELLGDVYNDGIIMTGGTSELKELAKYVSQRMRVRVVKPQDAQLCTVKGCGKGLEFINTLRKDEPTKVNPVKSASV